MTNQKLAKDYRTRARGRRKAIETLYDEGLFADVVRKCQEACELALKSVIRDAGHSVPMTHDVSAKLLEIQDDLSPHIAKNIKRMAEISKELRRDRETAFYGSEDITPSEFFNKNDANKAMGLLDEVLAAIPQQ